MSSNIPPKAQAISQHLMELVAQGAKMSHSFLSAEDQAYYISLYPELRPLIDEVQKNCIHLTQSLLQVNHSSSTPIPKLNYKDYEEILHNYNDVIHVTDEKLEIIDSYFDEINQQKNHSLKPTLQIDTIRTGNNVYEVRSTVNVQRPQLQFEMIDNSTAIFTPKITTKYNAKISLEEVWKNYDRIIKQGDPLSKHASEMGMDTETALCLPNPYEYEIDQYEFLPKQLTERNEILYSPTENTPVNWVNTVQQLQLMCDKLDKMEEIAIDLEHHAYRSYQGFTCLIQISTRSEDFIVDSLVLRGELSLLNRSFTNPNIVKVLHGSDNDILWLQRDFGVYIVNLFDTGQAARVLEYPSLSLSYLLEYFCNIKAEKKKFQLADWRIRPLPEDMLEYARSDTHYLLYIYDRMHNELLQKGNNYLLAALNNSREISKRAYTKEIFQPTLVSVQRKAPSFNPTQTNVLKAIFDWRDFFARKEDESVRYILPNHMMIRIAELLPQDPIELLSCCNPQPPPFIKTNASDLIAVIKDAMDNKNHKFVKPQTTTILPPLKLELADSKKTTDLFVDTAISQEELFERAEWPSKNKQTATLHDANECDDKMSSSAQFFSTPEKPKRQNEQKIAQVSSTLETAFCFGTPSDVPDSMEEIYQFSNANRKRNKEKKKLKEDSIAAGPVSPLKLDDEPSPKKQEGPQEFMKKIGWLSGDVVPLVSSAPSKKGRVTESNASKKQSKGNQQQAYDYSKHKSSNFGLQKEAKKAKGKANSANTTDAIQVPHYGRASTRARGSNKSSQRGKSYVSKGKKANSKNTF